MAIFINKGGANNKNSQAVRCALAVNWAVKEVLRPKLTSKYPELMSWWNLNHGIGIDTGVAFIARGGVRDNNDLVSIGSAPNVAAKMSEFRQESDIYISKAVFDAMVDGNKTSYDGRSMWQKLNSTKVGGKTIEMRGSYWTWEPGT